MVIDNSDFLKKMREWKNKRRGLGSQNRGEGKVIAKVKVGDYEFEILDEEPLTAEEFKEFLSEFPPESSSKGGYPRRKDIVVKYVEVIVPDDRIGFIRPFENPVFKKPKEGEE